jgi:phenylacetate-coenzyme A ligase PaaK-like adenylate-forming protein
MASIPTLLAKARNSAYLAYQLIGQSGVPYLSPEELRARRDRNVRAIVAYAAHHVPYYRELFQAGNISLSAIQTADDLKNCP